MEFNYNDGGRAKAGFKGKTRDCVVRAIAIATDTDYAVVYKKLKSMMNAKGLRSPRYGVEPSVFDTYLKDLGWKWVATMKFGKGCTTHMVYDELIEGTIIVRLSHHLSTVIDGVINDTYDCSKGGKRCVYGYYIYDEN